MNYDLFSDSTERGNMVINEAARILYSRLCNGPAIQSPSDANQFLQMKLAGRDREVFGLLLLNNKHNVIGFEELFTGTINESAVYPREVLKLAIMKGAAAVIAVHNHPSGDPEPSKADINLTNKLKAALDMVDIRLLDHIIVSHNQTASLKENGLM